MTSIAINPVCGDAGACDQVTINVNCTCNPQPPAPSQPRLNEAALHGFDMATVLPHYCNHMTTYSGPLLVGTTAILPAGTPLAAVGVAVAAPGEGDAGQDSRFGVYIGGIAELAARTPHKANLFTSDGWRWANLERPIAAAEVDRIVWLVAQVPHFLTAGPSFLSIRQVHGTNMVGGLRRRSVIVQGYKELPPIFDGDAVPMSDQMSVPAMAGSSTPVAQP
jgi:hypothetical protein